MPIDPQNNLSSYLLRPDLSARHRRRWRGFSTGIMVLGRANPRLLPHLVGSLLVWCLLVASVRYITTPHSLSTQTSLTSDSQTSFSLPAHPVSSVKPLSSAAPVATVASAQSLPSGPSGQPIQPSPVAPDGTYRNSYAWGQCTWYVAGRRQIPAHWGNADSWYSHAVAAGWKVGTTPAIGAVAWTSAGYYGHVALVEQISPDGKSVYVSEMNYSYVDVKDHRWAPVTDFKYIY